MRAPPADKPHLAPVMFGTPALFLKQLFSDGSQSLAILDGQPVEGMLQSLGLPHIPIHILIAMEDLDVKAMTRRPKPKPDSAKPGHYLPDGAKAKAGLNQSILSNNWSRLMKRLQDKMDANGGNLVIVPAAYTSQACHKCGHVAKGNRDSQAVFRCVECGYEANADINAAKNILSRALNKTGGGTA